MRAVVLQQQQKKERKDRRMRHWENSHQTIYSKQNPLLTTTQEFSVLLLKSFPYYSRVSVLSNKLLGHTRKKQGEMILKKKKKKTTKAKTKNNWSHFMK